MSLSWPGQERFSFPGQIAKDADVMTKRLNRVMVSFIKNPLLKLDDRMEAKARTISSDFC